MLVTTSFIGTRIPRKRNNLLIVNPPKDVHPKDPVVVHMYIKIIHNGSRGGLSIKVKREDGCGVFPRSGYVTPQHKM